ncbi:MAG TPA: DUF3047 domain-containing protein [Burkholderiaceae bacterium]|jgi:hypothetical protein
MPDPEEVQSSRRRWCLGALAAVGMSGCAPVLPGLPKGSDPATARVVPFSASRRLGDVPEGWREQVMRRDLPATRYLSATRDGRTVAHAVADKSTSGLRCDVDIDPNTTPWLNWEWRVDDVEREATVARSDSDDSPARVILGFDGDMSTLTLRELMFQEQVELFAGQVLPFAMLMYVWDGQAAPESVFNYGRSARIRYLVVESGPRSTGRWIGYRRNVVDDYRRVFGSEPGRIRSVGVMTNSDDLKTHSEAWFGDLVFGRRA